MSIQSPPSRPAGDCCASADVSPVSVVVPVRNEAKFIERTLTQLVGQSYDGNRFEILVVDGQSSDGTPELVEKFATRYPNVRRLSNPKRLSSAARNIGIREARGDVVLIVDGHCEFENDCYLHNVAAAFDRSGADCIGRPQPLDVSGASSMQRAIAAARSSRLGHHPDSHIYSSREGFVPAKSVAVAYRRSVFEQVGYFDENFDVCGGVEFNHRIDRAGLRCYFTPQVAVRYAPRDSLRGLFRQLVRYGRGRVRLLRKHPQTLSLKSLAPAAFVVGCFAGLVLSWLFWWMIDFYLVVLATYAAGVLIASAAIATQQRLIRIFPWLLLIFLIIHVASGAGVLIQAFACFRTQPRQPWPWPGSRPRPGMAHASGCGTSTVTCPNPTAGNYPT